MNNKKSKAFYIAVCFLIAEAILWLLYLTVISQMIGSIDDFGKEAERYWTAVKIWVPIMFLCSVLFFVSISVIVFKMKKLHIALKIISCIFSLAGIFIMFIVGVVTWFGGFA